MGRLGKSLVKEKGNSEGSRVSRLKGVVKEWSKGRVKGGVKVKGRSG